MTERPSRRVVLAVALAVAGLLTGAPQATAQADDPAPKISPKEAAAKAAAKAEKAAVRKVLDAVALDFQGERTAKLIARVPETATLTLTLGTANRVRLKRAAAKQVLQTWFDAKEVRRVGLTKHKGLVGIFDLRYRAKGKDAVKTRKLAIELRKSEDGKSFLLQRIELHRT